MNEQPPKEPQQALEFAEEIVASVREPLLVLDASLRIIWANNSLETGQIADDYQNGLSPNMEQYSRSRHLPICQTAVQYSLPDL
jgi:hypothetical protein